MSRRRILLAAITSTLVGGVAIAAPKKKVKIETDPPGATVYLNTKEDGPVCTTPCTIDVPVGDTPIIVELENHKQLFENLVVPARKPVTVKYKLVPSIGTINVKGPAGARIVVDDEDQGKAPAKIEVGAGAHTVVLSMDGKTIATEFVDVVANEEVAVDARPPTGGSGGSKKPPPDEVADTSNGSSGGDGSTGVSSSGTSTTAKTERGPYVSLAVAMDVGFRNFEYDNPQTANLTPEKEGGQVLVGPVVELWPGTLAGVDFLRGLSLFVRFGYGVNSQAVKQRVSMTTTSAKTFWRAFEASLRHRWTIKESFTLEIGGGYVRDQYQFEGMVQDIDLVPDADYQSMKIGARASALLGVMEPYFLFENRFVLSGGTIEKRFTEASASGLRVAVGAIANFGALNVRVEGALNRYAWTFENTNPMPQFNADGGTDSIKFITAAIGYAY